MVRVVLFLVFVAALATGLSWLADRPGSLLINWQGYEIRTSVFRAVVMLAILVGAAIVMWQIVRGVWQLPAGLGNFFNRRREKRGLEALSSGLLAIGAGDRSLATRYAVQARKSLPNEPLTYILRAQAAQLAGDRQTARRIYEAMLGAPETETFGLRGLFLEAEREGEIEAARQFAERAMEINPKLSWPVTALFDLQCRAKDWQAALDTLASARKHGHLDKAVADRRRAVLLTAQAQMLEDNDPERAVRLAEEAHKLANDLIPATAIAGRIAASRGNVQKATKILEKGWRKQAHPDIATAYAYARLGDSPRDRLNRVKKLASLSPHSMESPIAVATAAIEARDFETARQVLLPLTEGRLTQRVCTLMARVEGEDGANVGAVREWLARAVNAPRDPAWTADGVVADDWAPVSPVSGQLDAFQWRVPVEAAEPRDGAILAEKIEELVKLGARPETVAAAAPGMAAAVGLTPVPVGSSDPAAAAARPDAAEMSTQGSVSEDPAEAPKPGASSTAQSGETKPSAPKRAEDVVDAQVVEPTAPAGKPEVALGKAAGVDAASIDKGVVAGRAQPVAQSAPAQGAGSSAKSHAAINGADDAPAGGGTVGVGAAQAGAATAVAKALDSGDAAVKGAGLKADASTAATGAGAQASAGAEVKDDKGAENPVRSADGDAGGASTSGTGAAQARGDERSKAKAGADA